MNQQTDKKLFKQFEKRYNALDDYMKMYYRERILIECWNINADRKNKEIKDFNKNKKRWQFKKTGHYPSYWGGPIRMPEVFIVPPVFHPQYKKAKKLIEDYIKYYKKMEKSDA